MKLFAFLASLRETQIFSFFQVARQSSAAFELEEPAAFLFDQIIFNAPGGLGCFEDFSPRRIAFAEKHSVAFVGAGRPVLAVNRLDSARVRVDPRHRVGLGFDAGADVELHHELLGRIGGDDLDGTLTLQRHELGLMIVIAGTHAQRFQLLHNLRELIGQSFPAVQPGDSPGAGHYDVFRAQDLVKLDGFGKSRDREGGLIVVG